MRILGSAALWIAAIAGSGAIGIGAANAWQQDAVASFKTGIGRHFYYVDDTPAWESLSKNISSIGLLSPTWFYLQDNGEIRVAMDARVKQMAAQNGVPLMPVVMNENFRVEAARAAFDESRQDSVIASLLRVAAAEDFRGLQLDFENLEPSDREPYTRFVERLGAGLRKQNKTLSVAVVSNVYAPVSSNTKAETWQPTPRSAAFDYERLARASEFITLMTYDQYTSPEAPGPVAGIGWMEACIRKALEGVSPAKISLGVPLYHRHWTGKQVTTGTWIEAQEWSWKTKTGSIFDALHEEPVLRFGEGPVEHTIWFHNARSVRRRVELAVRYRLRGISAWRIGQEDPSVWSEGLNPTQGGGRP